MPPSINTKIYDEVVGARADICVLDEKVDTLTDMVQEHERLLYKGNGKEGVVDRVRQLEKKEDARAKKRQDDIKLQKGFLYSLIGAIVLVALDIVLHYLNII